MSDTEKRKRKALPLRCAWANLTAANACSRTKTPGERKRGRGREGGKEEEERRGGEGGGEEGGGEEERREEEREEKGGNGGSRGTGRGEGVEKGEKEGRRWEKEGLLDIPLKVQQQEVELGNQSCCCKILMKLCKCDCC